MKKIILVIICSMLIVFNIQGFGQNKKLNSLRKKYINNEKKQFLYEYKQYRVKINKVPPYKIIPTSVKFNKLVKFYTIPASERLKIYPFNVYDSIYFSTFNFIEDEQPRDYLDTKYHNYLKLLNKQEINQITNILFNYFKMKEGHVTIFNSKNNGCDDIYSEYPKMMLLFKKNRKFTHYIAFPENGKKRSNFFEGKDMFEFWAELDLCAEKEDLILKKFGFDRNYN